MTNTTPELQIEPKLPVLSFNFDQLKSWATDLTERYANLVVTEDAIADVKKDMAEINKAKKSVDDARKALVFRVSEPIRAFEAQIKEVCSIFDTAYTKLGIQVKAFEDAQREAKRKDVRAIIAESNTKAFGEQDFLDIPIQEKWLNKTTSTKTVREDISAIIERYKEDEQRRLALKQAQLDRAIAIENHVRSLNEKYGLNVPVALVVTTGLDEYPSLPLSEIIDGISKVFAVKSAEAEKETAIANQSKAYEKPEYIEQPTPKTEHQAGTIGTRAMSIVIEFDATKETQVNACLDKLKILCVNFGARLR